MSGRLSKCKTGANTHPSNSLCGIDDLIPTRNGFDNHMNVSGNAHVNIDKTSSYFVGMYVYIQWL